MFIDYDNEHKCNIDENIIGFGPCNISSGIVYVKDGNHDVIIKYNNKDIEEYKKDISDKILKNIENLKKENYIKIIGYIETELSSISCVYLPIKKSILVVFYIKRTDSCKYKIIQI